MIRIDSYADALRWLYARNPFSMKLGLEGPRRLLARLGNPEAGGVYLHVAGTNGKGSVCANLAAMLQAERVPRVGLYTSPHLVSFRERIRVDGEPVPADFVIRWLRESASALEDLNPTYFECATAMAFAWFREKGCGAVVLETGLGGRLDATNVVAPRITAVTSISLDHTRELGNTLESIWREKLGIVKAGIPLFVDESRPESARTAEAAARAASAPFVNLAARLSPAPGGFILRGQFGEYFLPEDLRPEEHQIRNAALSLLAFEAFRGERLSPADPWYSALREARLPGRAQWVEAEGKLPLLLDGAHNPAGMEALCRHLRALRLGRPRFLFAAMRDKDVASLYRMLRTVTEDVVYLDLGSAFPRALQARELQARLDPDERAGLREAAVAWKDLEPLLRPGGADYAVLCGSLYLLGAVIPLLLPHYRGLEEFGKLLDEERP